MRAPKNTPFPIWEGLTACSKEGKLFKSGFEPLAKVWQKISRTTEGRHIYDLNLEATKPPCPKTIELIIEILDDPYFLRDSEETWTSPGSLRPALERAKAILGGRFRCESIDSTTIEILTKFYLYTPPNKKELKFLALWAEAESENYERDSWKRDLETQIRNEKEKRDMNVARKGGHDKWD